MGPRGRREAERQTPFQTTTAFSYLLPTPTTRRRGISVSARTPRHPSPWPSLKHTLFICYILSKALSSFATSSLDCLLAQASSPAHPETSFGRSTAGLLSLGWHSAARHWRVEVCRNGALLSLERAVRRIRLYLSKPNRDSAVACRGPSTQGSLRNRQRPRRSPVLGSPARFGWRVGMATCKPCGSKAAQPPKLAPIRLCMRTACFLPPFYRCSTRWKLGNGPLSPSRPAAPSSF